MHRTGSLFAGAPSAIGWLPEASANPCRTGCRRCRCSLLALLLILYSFLCLLLLRFQPAPQEFTEFLPLTAHQPLQVQNARPTLPLVPRRPQPPVVRPTLAHPEFHNPHKPQTTRPGRPHVTGGFGPPATSRANGPPDAAAPAAVPTRAVALSDRDAAADRARRTTGHPAAGA